MEEWIEIEGNSKEDAIERACNALNTTESHLAYEFLDGQGVKIRARKLEEGEEPAKKERRNSADRDEEEEQKSDPELGKKAKEILSEIVSHIEQDVEVEIRETRDAIELDMLGNGSGVLIGKRGQTLEALQHLVTKMLGLDSRSSKKILIDSEGYRERRKESLENLARRLASRAKREGRSISADPMNAFDRRILHTTLANDSGVTTKSVGEGDGRRVMIVPSRRRGRNSNRRGYNNGPGRGRSRGRNGNQRGPREDRQAVSGRRHDSFHVPPEPDVHFSPEEAAMLEAEEERLAHEMEDQHERYPDSSDDYDREEE